ncbi:glycosyl transferase [Aliarcobacter vitoriensis]|uniref:glycosyl transferase n=1 Tax=Aliarcobacter vitoriensis TaxID=2011099 RepID=UPI003AAF7167
MEFKKFIKAVGTGPKGNKDLTLEETQRVIEMILNRDLSDAQIGAFLIAWRTRLETNEELKGCINTLDSFIHKKEIKDSMVLGYNFNGRTNNPYLFPFFENILSDFYKKNSDIRRLNLVISGDFLQPAKDGVTTKDIFTNIDKGQFVHYFDRIEYLRELSNLTKLRKELVMRTAFNTVEKLLNPSLSEYAITGVVHKPYVAKYLDIFKDRYKDITVIRGVEGDVEVFKDSKYWQKVDDEIKEFSFSLKDFGIDYKKEYENISLQECLNIVKQPDENILKLAKFNIALYLLFSKRVSSLDEAWQRLN